LPFVEQMARYDAVVNSDRRINVNGGLDGDDDGSEDTHPARRAFQASIGAYLCPSDPSAWLPGIGAFRTARCNIMTCRGDFVAHVANLSHGQAPFNVQRAPFMMTTNADGNFGGAQTIAAGGYLFAAEREFGAIHDGLSNTMAASEAVSARSQESASIFGGVIVLNFVIADNANTRRNPQECLNVFNRTTREYNVTTSGFGNVAGQLSSHNMGAQRGNHFPCGRIPRTGFNANLPPNSPACVNNAVEGREGAGFFPATSMHTGGVNVLLFDGAVRFVSDTVYAGRATDDQTTDGGQSRYGVWGGMATIAQGEAVAL